MLWVMESEAFYLESLQSQTHYRNLLALVPDEIFLDELAEDLTDCCKRNHVSRLSMIRTLGKVAIKRRKEIEEIMKHRVGNKFDWKIVSAGTFDKSNLFSRIMASLIAPLPVVWVRIAV